MLQASGLSVALEDTDPYRDCRQWPAASRLAEAEVARWQRCFQDAWQEIESYFPAYAPAIAAGLTVLMPMSAPPPGRDISAAARHDPPSQETTARFSPGHLPKPPMSSPYLGQFRG